jgi:phosphate transport system substrate-binding protein
LRVITIASVSTPLAEEGTIKLPAGFSASKITQQPPRQGWASYFYLGLLLTLSWHADPAAAQDAIVLVGSGSSVPAPLYQRWTQEFGKRNRGIQMRYLPVGTSEGIKQIAHGAGDFSAGEAQLTEKDRREGGLIELPVTLIAIVPIYNLPEIHQELRISGEVLAAIFLGEVKTWNSPQIAKLNPEITLPAVPIQVINRPGGKGSNYVLTDFLSKESSRFRAQVGVTPSPKWPVGESAERSSDMAEKVRSNPGSIGFVEYEYAVKENISQAVVLNASGKFVKASTESVEAACKAAEAPRWNNFTASLADTPGADSFPITSFSWIYLRTASSNSARTAALIDLLNWIYTDGQQYAAEEGYAALPDPLLAALRKRVGDLR